MCGAAGLRERGGPGVVCGFPGRWFARGFVLGGGGGVRLAIVLGDYGVGPAFLVSFSGDPRCPFPLDEERGDGGEGFADATPTFVLPRPGGGGFFVGFAHPTARPAWSR